jgi:putative transcriptional regulator
MSSLAVVPVARSIIYLGMDVHKDSITLAVLPEGAKAPSRLDRLSNDLPKLKKWIDRVARDGEIHACYEASGAGYVLHRALLERRGLTLTELSERMGITLANLSILKTNKARAIRLSTLEALCRELDCQPGDLLVYDAADSRRRRR